jgi:hypothetical protein
MWGARQNRVRGFEISKKGKFARSCRARHMQPGLRTDRPLAVSSDWRPLDPLLDEYRFRSLGKLVVRNLDRIADVSNARATKKGEAAVVISLLVQAGDERVTLVVYHFKYSLRHLLNRLINFRTIAVSASEMMVGIAFAALVNCVDGPAHCRGGVSLVAHMRVV